MNDIAIKAEGLSKLYKIGVSRESYQTLRDAIASVFERSKVQRPSEHFWALKDVSFEVKRGEVAGIIGRNGAGKTTLLKILARITEPTEGYAEIRGRVKPLLEVGTGFHPELTGRENIYLNGAILGMKKAEIEGKFDEIVAFAEIEKFIDTPVKRYSSGMYVRLAFAVAAHLEPEILLVDEVLAVGDAAFQKKCMGRMGDVAKEGRTVLFVSHNMAAVQGLCSRCYLIGAGELVAEGYPRSVIENYLADLSPRSSIGLDERKDRKGSGEVKFTAVSILNSKWIPIDHVLSGQDIVIAISYQSGNNKPVSRLDIHVTMYTPTGQFLFTCSSESSGCLSDRVPSQGRAMCHIPELPLAPGRYVYNLFGTVGGAIADWVQEAGYLEVAAGDYFGTGQLRTHEEGFLVKHKWFFKEL